MTLLLVACTGPGAPSPDSARDRDSGPADSAPDTAPDDTARDTDTEDTAPDDTAPPPADADADGVPDVDDCEPANAWVHPGATEYCDAVDQDCDGEPLAVGGCAYAAEPEAAARWLFEAGTSGTRAFGLVSDLTGDDAGDAVVWNEDWVAIVRGGVLPEAPLEVPSEAFHTVSLLHASTWDLGHDPIDVGDVDGDGVNDLGLVSHLGAAGIHLVYGPFEEGGASALGAGDAAWPARYNQDNWGFDTLGGFDFDGDGRADAVANNLYAFWDYDETVEYDLDVYFGGEWAADCPIGSSGGHPTGPVAMGDLDGDGLDEFEINAYSRPMFLSGGDLRGACGATLEDTARAWMPEFKGDLVAWAAVGDWNGDGLADFVGGDAASSTVGDGHGEIFIYTGLQGEFTSDDALGSWVGSGDGARLGGALRAPDIDGDGVRDLGSEDAFERVDVILRGGTVPSLRSALPDRMIRLPYGSLDFADFDADGADDIMVVTADTTTVRIGISRGFEVPWDDPLYW